MNDAGSVDDARGVAAGAGRRMSVAPPQHNAHQQPERRPDAVNTPITKPGQRRRKREDFDRHAQRSDPVHQRPVRSDDQTERPGRMRIAQTRPAFREARLRPRQPGRSARETECSQKSLSYDDRIAGLDEIGWLGVELLALVADDPNDAKTTVRPAFD